MISQPGQDRSAGAGTRPGTWPPPQAGPPPPPPGGPGGLGEFRAVLAVLVAVLLVVAGGVAGGLIALNIHGGGGTAGSPGTRVVSPGAGTGQAGQSLTAAAAAARLSVVTVQVTNGNGASEGSGVVLRADGTILTNDHVISGATGGAGSITVTFVSGRSVPAVIVGRDPAADIAVIRAEGVTGAPVARIGSAAGLRVGDTVLAIGSPLGLLDSVTAGIVSALHRTISVGGQEPNESTPGAPSPGATINDMIQTDTAINPGNSGGALVDAAGRVVGITTAIASVGGGYVGQQSGSIGVGFAIPIGVATSIANRLVGG
ncbi:MAG: S1C family serine protease [Streptosporangiaceae bacterium]